MRLIKTTTTDYFVVDRGNFYLCLPFRLLHGYCSLGSTRFLVRRKVEQNNLKNIQYVKKHVSMAEVLTNAHGLGVGEKPL